LQVPFKPEIDAQGFGVSYVQITVGLGRKPCFDAAYFSAFEVFVDNLFDKIFCFHFLPRD
jgi:hypothetical protein